MVVLADVLSILTFGLSFFAAVAILIVRIGAAREKSGFGFVAASFGFLALAGLASLTGYTEVALSYITLSLYAALAASVSWDKMRQSVLYYFEGGAAQFFGDKK